MFTNDQLEQLKKLFLANNELIKKTVREEITIESIKIRQDGEQERIEILNSLGDIGDELKDVIITSTRLESGQNELRSELGELRVGQEQLRNSVGKLQLTVDKHNKTLQYMKKKVNRIDSTVEIIGRSYNVEIVDNRRRIKNLESVVGVT